MDRVNVRFVSKNPFCLDFAVDFDLDRFSRRTRKMSVEETPEVVVDEAATPGAQLNDKVTVIVHPLVLLSTVDHYNRVAKVCNRADCPRAPAAP